MIMWYLCAGLIFVLKFVPEISGFVSVSTLKNMSEGYVDDDMLIFSVEMTSLESSNSNSWLSADLRALLYSDKSCGRDVKFKFKNAEDDLWAHKAILAVRSPLFKAMFASGMSECVSGEIEVVDLEPKIMKELLTFLYTDAFSTPAVTDDEETIRSLLAAAHFYDVPCLRTECEAALIAQLRPDNVCPLLLLAESVSANELKKACVHFAVSNCPEVFRTAQYVGNASDGESLIAAFTAGKDIQKSNNGSTPSI
jgi:hypothetical protein